MLAVKSLCHAPDGLDELPTEASYRSEMATPLSGAQ
jgi:hypothetical protein